MLTTSTSGRSLLTQCLSHDQVFARTLLLQQDIRCLIIGSQAILSPLLQAIGRIIQPEILQEAPIALRAMVEGPTGKESACECFVVGGDTGAPVLVAVCRAAVTPERSAAWANGLFAEIHAERVICISSMPVRASCKHVCRLMKLCRRASFARPRADVWDIQAVPRANGRGVWMQAGSPISRT